jgi:hypothetical protein
MKIALPYKQIPFNRIKKAPCVFLLAGLGLSVSDVGCSNL